MQLRVTGSCDSETVTLDWTEATGALAYLITADGDLGGASSYETNDTTLEAELLCGQSYTFSVRARGPACDGPLSDPARFTTGTGGLRAPGPGRVEPPTESLICIFLFF